MEHEEHKCKYLMLYLKTGGGHLAPAKSVSNYIQQNYTDKIEPVLIDGLAEAPSYARFIVEDGYRILQSKAKWYYELLYALNKIIGIAKYNSLLVSERIKPYLKEKILNEEPCKIVIFHFFLIKPVYDILRENKLSIPVVTVVTDPFIAHPIWFLNKQQTMIVFSQQLKNYALKKNIPHEKVHVFPFILDEKYSAPMPKEEIPVLKKRLGFEVNKKIVLIMGGGDGIPKGEMILKNLLEELPEVCLAIVCGKNKSLYEFALELKKKGNYENLKVYGYISFVYNLLSVSDVVITKCGASTFMEILMTRKIPVVNDYIWEQEKGNVEFLVKNRLGVYEKNMKKLPHVVKKLLKDEAFYQSYIINIEKAHLRNGTADVAEFLVKN
ncbi:MAG TPA: glycosyltransferase [Ignavibacteriales bacterium]|nr:glycosyltransferase [Ignavibacteriales bacterium]